MHVRPNLAVLFYVHLGNKYVFKSINDADVRNLPSLQHINIVLSSSYLQRCFSTTSSLSTITSSSINLERI